MARARITPARARHRNNSSRRSPPQASASCSCTMWRRATNGLRWKTGLLIPSARIFACGTTSAARHCPRSVKRLFGSGLDTLGRLRNYGSRRPTFSSKAAACLHSNHRNKTNAATYEVAARVALLHRSKQASRARLDLCSTSPHRRQGATPCPPRIPKPSSTVTIGCAP